MITKKLAFEKQQGLYHNKVTLSLTPVQRPGNQAHICKMDYYVILQKVKVTYTYVKKQFHVF